MVGYPESFTDPSYLNQILVLTYPLIGNYGISEPEYDDGIDKIFESGDIHIKALIVGEYNPNIHIGEVKKSLGEWLNEKGIIGISGVDTRELVKIIRENSNIVGKITSNETLNATSSPSLDEITRNTLAQNVSLKLPNKAPVDSKVIINENSELLNI